MTSTLSCGDLNPITTRQQRSTSGARARPLVSLADGAGMQVSLSRTGDGFLATGEPEFFYVRIEQEDNDRA